MVGRFTFKIITLALSVALVASSAFAERRSCGTVEHDNATKLRIDADMKARLAAKGGVSPLAVNIPTYWYVLQSDSYPNDVSMSQIEDQIAVLNAAYESIGFTFSLGGAYTVSTSDEYASFGPGSAAENLVKTELRQGGSGDLNVYVTKNEEGLLGWATFPSDYEYYPTMDGVVVLYSALPGGSPPYDLGDTMTHEVGHWLGLYHTFQGSCSKQNDLVKDTPAHKVNYECSAADTCKKAGVRHHKGKDPIHNFMDYTDDACMNRFSRGQLQRVVESFSAYRM